MIEFLHNYFDGPTKFLDLYLTKFLNVSANCYFCVMKNIVINNKCRL